MNLKIILQITILLSAFLFINCAPAAYFPSASLITDEDDASIECPETCRANLTSWTGKWWITADPISVCECFHTSVWP
jgi:hypothetical protein